MMLYIFTLRNFDRPVHLDCPMDPHAQANFLCNAR